VDEPHRRKQEIIMKSFRQLADLLLSFVARQKKVNQMV
jgi:hypothetical protein